MAWQGTGVSTLAKVRSDIVYRHCSVLHFYPNLEFALRGLWYAIAPKLSLKAYGSGMGLNQQTSYHRSRHRLQGAHPQSR